MPPRPTSELPARPRLAGSPPGIARHNTMNDPQLYIVEVDDQRDQRLAGQAGCRVYLPAAVRDPSALTRRARCSVTTSGRFASPTRPGALRSPAAGASFTCTALGPTASSSSKHTTLRTLGLARMRRTQCRVGTRRRHRPQTRHHIPPQPRPLEALSRNLAPVRHAGADASFRREAAVSNDADDGSERAAIS
jgi:hypothetical protein